MIKDPIEKIKYLASQINLDCGDNSCVFANFGSKGGMRTNGGCRCIENLRGPNAVYVRRLIQVAKELCPPERSDNEGVS